MPRLPAKLECPHATLDPGGRLQCRLLVYNAAERVDQVTLDVQGPLAPWANVNPRELAIMPRTEDAFDVTVELPTEAQIEAGTRPLMIEARSGLAGTEPSLKEIDIDIGRRTEADLSLHHRAARHGQGVYEARVANRSNHPVSLDIEVDARVRTQVRPATIEVAPFAVAVSRIIVHRDLDDDAPVDLVARASGIGIDIEAHATYTGPVTPQRLPWVAGAAALVVLVALLAISDPFDLLGGEDVADDNGEATTEATAEATTEPPLVLEPIVDGFAPLSTREERALPVAWEATWQSMLDTQGYDLGDPGVDGRFGPLTGEATERFQDAENLTVDGTVDAPDWDRMLRLYRDAGEPSAVIDWHETAARELIRLLGLEVDVADTRQCGDIADVVAGAERTNGTVELTLASTEEPPC